MVGATERNTPKARLLGAELRDLRKKARMTVRDLGAELGLAQGTVSRYERGERTPEIAYVARLLGVLGVTGDRYDELIEFAKTASEPNLVADSRSGMHSHLIELSEYDRAATRTTHVAPLVVPGPFQTRAYATEIMSTVPPDEREVRIEMRMARREALYSQDAAIGLIAERVLCETMGSEAVMLEQLQHLVALAEQPNIDIRVIPSSVRTWTLAHNGSFILYEFAKAAPTVHLEHYRGPVFLYDTTDVDAYRQALDTLTTTAMSPEESADLMSDIAKKLEGIPQS
ncbi:helix-turn-helix domain-containing protein [Saccharopolyspora dendranthemae]|uniref:Helix-turn-helix protein n=1 Tax=Saccharopolyspora dendranthemae TaxID=1181886 RepID=A0A561U2R0_9PSEU|nr:helix-turn-helix transcriptional regulator [Saccharopolyspora dendranthemae]TWF93645.1 helix-turn-helix protein [Saccharopolyspora dendranthemae]